MEYKTTVRAKEERAGNLHRYNLGAPYLRSDLYNCENSTLESYHCHICPLEFDILTLLKKHIREEHFMENLFSLFDLKSHFCQNCTFQTYSHLQWFKHATDKCSQGKNLFMETSEIFFKCEKCDYKTQYKGHMNRHFYARHVSDEHKKEFEGDKHLKSKHLDERFECEICKYKALQRSSLKRHLNAYHTKKWFECEKCTFKTKRKDYLKRHFNALHADDKKWFRCEFCSYRTTEMPNLKRHVSSKHEKILFKCQHCNFETMKKDYLRSHFKAKHVADEDKKWFQCEKCAYKTIYKGDLKKHFNVRHAEDGEKKWFQCDKCTHRTADKCSLRRHFVKKHQLIL